MHPYCPLCYSKKTEYYCQTKDTENINQFIYTYYRCLICDLVFLFLQDKINFADYYQNNYYGGKRILNFLQYERVLKIRKLISEGNLLDYGCGEGIFISLLPKDEINGFGYDISPQAGALALKKSLQVVTLPKSINSYPANYFQIITLWHTLEHLSEPFFLLKSLNNLLTDKGYLIISVPNINSLEFLLAKNKWFHFDPPRHLFHYNENSLTYLLEKSGFKIVKTDYFSLEYNFASLWQTILNLCGSSPNFFYHQLKRQPAKNLTKKEVIISWLITIVIGSVILLPVIFIGLILPFIKLSGSFTVYAQKNSPHQS